MNKLRITLWTFLILTILTVGTVITLAGESKYPTIEVSESKVQLISGVPYTFDLVQQDNIVCIKNEDKSYTNPDCLKPKVDTKLDTTKTEVITSDKIIVDKSKYITIDKQTYEIVYNYNPKTKCICEKSSCKISECIQP